ncbi:uncharacterized protein LOC128266097 [Drosophila gunungcola]|uniref:uncharacterized protein LOC128266097 n=1 Tax=Drosophila gunungcola TaxID=103775 RepID=UPI0022E080AB|nr:uncharacterized protein LOC128266097 [Drosophila gunungcola]
MKKKIEQIVPGKVNVGNHKIDALPTLPKIQVPTFYGDSKDWDLFYELFNELIHLREDLSPSFKFSYLKISLKGEARNVVSHLLLGSGENYEAAWELLTKRYENKRKIFSDQLNRLLDLQIVNVDSVRQLKIFIDTINESIHMIKLKAQLSDEVDIMFAHIIIRKFNKEALQLYESHVKKTKEIQALSDVIEFLEQRLSSISSVQDEKPVKKIYSSNIRELATNNCPICKISGHFIFQCQKFKVLNPSERMEKVKNAHLCFKCLKHSFNKKCQSDISCSICKKNHHSMLHITYNVNQKLEKVNTCRTSEQALLATGRVQIKSSNGGFENFRALIDSGSQSTIISEESVQILKLQKIRSQTEISGVSSTGKCISKHKILSIKCNASQKILKVEALVLPKLMRALPAHKVNVDKTKWEKYNLDDPDFNKPGRVDLIIGADLYTDILQSGVVKINGLLGQKTDFGWIISGCKKSKGQKTIVATTIELKDMDRYWEVEDEDKNDIESEICENNFIKTTKIDTLCQFHLKMMLP